MDFTTILDTSTIIWNEKDYENNKSKYLVLANSIINLLGKITQPNQKTYLLLRSELLSQMQIGFPFYNLPPHFSSFRTLIYSYLTRLGGKRIVYPAMVTENLKSIPNQIKDYYNDDTKEEIKYLITKIHNGEELNKTYFTLEYFWDGEESLITTDGLNSYEHKLIVSDREKVVNSDVDHEVTHNELDAFLNQFKRIFDHNPKHDYVKGTRWENGELVHSLSCYDLIDPSIPQELLDGGFKSGKQIYNYNEGLYVVFKMHEETHWGKKYHGHDEPDSNKIPSDVKKHFRK